MKVLLTTLHAKYSHSSLALPCLAAYSRDIPGIDLILREWTVNEPRNLILRRIIEERAAVVAFSCYIWNTEDTLRIVGDVKKISPSTLIVLGGPEVSFGIFELMHAHPGVDFVIKGEGEKPFRRLLELLACHDCRNPPESECAGIENLFFRDGDDVVSGPPGTIPLNLDSLPSPFEAGLVDLSRQLTYYETSRGCPFSCAFCLSSIEGAVRTFGMERIKKDLLQLMHQNVSHIKLVDRTFNFDARRAGEIWEFILEHNRGSHFHFEIAADLLTEDNLRTLGRVQAHTFRFEIGVQSVSDEILARVGRTAQTEKIFEAVRRLRRETSIELHLDLLAGLPGESYAGFLDSLQAVASLQPHEIQIEPLKVLKGSPMREIAQREGYRYSGTPPYIILSNPWISYDDICRIEIIGRLLDLLHRCGGLETALVVLTQDMLFAAVLDRMAAQALEENLSGLSCRQTFELFARLAPLPEEPQRSEEFRDALFFDYCLREMPLMGKLPGFAADHRGHCSWPGQRDLRTGLDISPGCRVKVFRTTFGRDYRSGNRDEQATVCTFAYISGAGQGLRVVLT
ncbi:MAG TPA: DUF4080 domain-containing protein [Desulfuromonadales bacterium]|nr:DUF4080 domain-containing protein [Desulfuromonadales bacterium]